MKQMRLAIAAMIGALVLIAPHAAQAKVDVTFYSHEFGDSFPHAFIVLKGTIDATGEVVDTNYGFTAKTVSPAILFGSVTGIVESAEPAYVADSDPHFIVRLDDAGYARLIAKVVEWRDWPQKSYNLGKRNCVHFVMEAAETVGLKVNRKSRFFKKPRSFLNEVATLNPAVEKVAGE
jgi:hypothetical protein